MAPAPPCADLLPHRTADGSFTLRSADQAIWYHSLRGAVLESMHVFIRSGLAAVEPGHVRVLEVGLGTGLNLLLTWIRCIEGKCSVVYSALEPHPLGRGQLEQLGHCADLNWPGLHEPFLELMSAHPAETQVGEGGLCFTRHDTRVQDYEAREAFDVVFFDAFAPAADPGMWTLDVMQRMYRALVPGGLLVTYCAKGVVRRTLSEAGFLVERIPGPPGKRHMLRARKPALQ